MFDTYEDIFNERAGSYDEAMQRCPDARRAEFEMVLAPLPVSPGAVVCDMPAGGAYLRRYLPAGIDYVAIEPSGHFFRQCPSDATARRFQSSLTSVPLDDGSVDHIVSLAGLHHVADLDPVFAEMRRLVRPRGWIVIADVEAGSASDSFLNGFVNAHNPMGHAGVFFGPGTHEQLRHAGLQVVDDRPVAPRWTFTYALQMGSYCRSLFGIQRATASQVSDCIESTFDCRAGSGGISFGWPLRRLVCRPA